MPEGHGNDAERRRRRPHRTRMQDTPMISVAGKRAVCAGRGCAAPVFGPGVRLPCASGNKRKGSGTLEEQEILSALVLATSAAHRARGLLCADPNGDALSRHPYRGHGPSAGRGFRRPCGTGHRGPSCGRPLATSAQRTRGGGRRTVRKLRAVVSAGRPHRLGLYVCCNKRRTSRGRPP